MKYSPLNNIPISLGQRTPDVLRQSNRIRGNDLRGDYSLRQDTSTISHRPYISSASYNDRSGFVDQEPSRVYGKSLLQESRTSFQDPYSQQKNYSARRPEESYSSLNRSYQPMTSSQPMGSSYISRAYETYVARPQELVHIVMSSYIVNSGILLLTSFAFLLLCLNFLSLIHHGWHYSLDTWQFLRALLFLAAILISKALMLKYYDTFINWNDVVRDLFRGPLFLITLVFSLIAIIAYTYDMFTFLILGKTYEEFSHVLIICIVNSIALIVKSLSHKEYLLASSSFETNLSYLSEYSLKNLFKIGYKQVRHSIKIVLISALLCYSGLISLIFEETLSMLSYEYLQFPGLWKALTSAMVYFVGLFYANFILEVQVKVMKRVWIRVLSDIGSMRYAMKSLYYFNDRTESDDALVGHCLRFLDTKLRYECRNSLLRRQNPGDPESKTIWHVLVETTLEKMDRINNQLQTLKASRLVMSGNFGPKGHHENLLMALEYFFTSPPDVRDVRALYHDLCLAAHQFKVINRVFREMKILNLDVALRNFNINLQTYYQGLYNIYNILWQVKNINQSTYVDSLLTDISHFEEVIKEGLLMLNKFVAL